MFRRKKEGILRRRERKQRALDKQRGFLDGQGLVERNITADAKREMEMWMHLPTRTDLSLKDSPWNVPGNHEKFGGRKRARRIDYERVVVKETRDRHKFCINIPVWVKERVGRLDVQRQRRKKSAQANARLYDRLRLGHKKERCVAVLSSLRQRREVFKYTEDIWRGHPHEYLSTFLTDATG